MRGAPGAVPGASKLLVYKYDEVFKVLFHCLSSLPLFFIALMHVSPLTCKLLVYKYEEVFKVLKFYHCLFSPPLFFIARACAGNRSRQPFAAALSALFPACVYFFSEFFLFLRYFICRRRA